MDELGCNEVRDLAPELALGIVDGRLRASAIRHLDGCPACRDAAAELAATADQLFQLAPGVEPPVGFEDRFMRRFSRARRRPLRRVWQVAAAAAIVVAVGLGGWAVRGHNGVPSPGRPSASLIAASFHAGDHQVGRVYAHPGQSSWLYMQVDLDGAAGPVSCQVITRNGTAVTLGTFGLSGGYGYWGTPSPVPAASLTAARLVDGHGRVLATATFGQ